ncbi:hypothetical protein SLW73_02500 [Glutamicibacter protophormiae]|uniref:hypothetical protein n=1 Tax=Glutamicibacter protophormiae TaxID=37930 RepID=UPI002A7EC905|nr:hypothetical protein [Glutamicibacter protophormiae]WPR65230.1 hypothetical protein SLW72_02500 [Glutamicibacter protophormiae]WPR68727.1 hypothetical protein SLW73_02500 [Glutamicibacter protophormiae]
MPDTPLNPDALASVARAQFEADRSESPKPEVWGEWEEQDTAQQGLYRSEVAETVQAYLAAALPEVTEREQLTALPDKIVLEDRRGTIWQKINGTWYTPGSKHDYSDQSVMLPARVLHRPEVKP